MRETNLYASSQSSYKKKDSYISLRKTRWSQTTKQEQTALMVRGVGMKIDCLMSVRFPFGVIKNVLELVRGGDCTTL